MDRAERRMEERLTALDRKVNMIVYLKDDAVEGEFKEV